MSSKKIGGCIVHGLKLPSGCSTRRIRHPELIYEPPSLNSGMEPDCLESEYVNIPPVPYYKAKWKVCQPSKSLKPYCPPSPCVCPPKPVIIPLRHRLKNLFWTSVKLALFVGIVKVTDDLRIWSTSDETESLYFNVQETISPAEPEGDIIQESELPGMERIFYYIRRKWNASIIYMFRLFGVHPKASIDAYVYGSEDKR